MAKTTACIYNQSQCSTTYADNEVSVRWSFDSFHTHLTLCTYSSQMQEKTTLEHTCFTSRTLSSRMQEKTEDIMVGGVLV